MQLKMLILFFSLEIIWCLNWRKKVFKNYMKKLKCFWCVYWLILSMRVYGLMLIILSFILKNWLRKLISWKRKFMRMLVLYLMWLFFVRLGKFFLRRWSCFIVLKKLSLDSILLVKRSWQNWLESILLFRKYWIIEV